MFKRFKQLKNWFDHQLASFSFWYAITWGKVKGTKQTNVHINKKLKHTQIKYAVGESYQITAGVTVTLCASKQEVQERIEAANMRRAAKQALLTQKGEAMMLMSPEELYQFKVNDWLLERAKALELIASINLLEEDEVTPPPNGVKDDE